MLCSYTILSSLSFCAEHNTSKDNKQYVIPVDSKNNSQEKNQVIVSLIDKQNAHALKEEILNKVDSRLDTTMNFISTVATITGVILAIFAIIFTTLTAVGLLEVREWKRIRKNIEEDAKTIKNLRKNAEQDAQKLRT